MRTVCIFTTVAALVGTTQAATFSGLVDFGDSLSDVGNLYNTTASFGGLVPVTPGGPGYFGGRFSNGTVWVEQLAGKLGVSVPKASTVGGTDYAYGDVTSGTGTTNGFLPNVRTQINNWTTNNVSTSAQLFTVLGGANDLFAAIDSTTATPAQQTAVAVTAAQNIAGGVQALYADGARNVLVANLPNLGLVPRYRNTGLQATATSLTATFNTTLAASLATVSSSSSGLHLYNLDLQALFAAAILSPGTFGLTNVTTPAYTGDPDYAGTGTSVADPSGYLFWDQVHPTTVGHGLVANAALAAIPEPAGLAVLAVAGVLLRRRRAA